MHMKVLFYFLAALSLATIWKGFPEMGLLLKILLSIVALTVLHLIFDKALEKKNKQ